MAEVTLTSILKDIRTLSPDQLRKVRGFVDDQLLAATKDDPDEEVLQAMLHAGLISEIKRPDSTPGLERPLATIVGKPLSETIVEGRR